VTMCVKTPHNHADRQHMISLYTCLKTSSQFAENENVGTMFCRTLYWTDWGSTDPGIYRSSISDVSREPLITTDIVWPNALAVDFTGKHSIAQSVLTNKTMFCHWWCVCDFVDM